MFSPNVVPVKQAVAYAPGLDTGDSVASVVCIGSTRTSFRGATHQLKHDICRRCHARSKTELCRSITYALSGALKASGKHAKAIPPTAGMLPDGRVLLLVVDEGGASHAPPLDAPCGVRAVVEDRSLVVTCAHRHGLRELTRWPELGGRMASGCKAAREARRGRGRTPAALGIMRFISAPDA